MGAWCQEVERSRLASGRMCWHLAARRCGRCSRIVCYAHTRRTASDQPVCVSCAEAGG